MIRSPTQTLIEACLHLSKEILKLLAHHEEEKQVALGRGQNPETRRDAPRVHNGILLRRCELLENFRNLIGWHRFNPCLIRFNLIKFEHEPEQRHSANDSSSSPQIVFKGKMTKHGQDKVKSNPNLEGCHEQPFGVGDHELEPPRSTPRRARYRLIVVNEKPVFAAILGLDQPSFLSLTICPISRAVG